MDRQMLQEQAADLLYEKKRLVCEWATSVGKSGVVLQFLKKNPGCNCLILVPEQNNIENWREEFRKFSVPDDKVTIICYASLHKFERSSWDLLVLDEVPHMDTDKRRKLCESISGEYILALGAVIDEDEMQTLRSVYGSFSVSRISLETGIRMGIIVPPSIYVLHLQLDDTRQDQWYKGRSYTARKLNDLLNEKVDAAVAAYNASSSTWNKQAMFRAGVERKRFLGAQKEEALMRLSAYLAQRNLRFLCFCSSIEQAEKLGGENAFTSKSAKSMKHLDRFNNHEIDSLFVVGKLIEGQNLKDIDCGIIGQIGGTQRITVQEIGRVLRSKNPAIYIPIFDGTKDESFLHTLTANISADYIKHYKF